MIGTKRRGRLSVQLGITAVCVSALVVFGTTLPSQASARQPAHERRSAAQRLATHRAAASKISSITFAETAAQPPNCIFPIGTLTCFVVANSSQFQDLMYRPLYWFGTKGSLAPNKALSLATLPVWNSSSTALTIHLKPYKWSNGTDLTSRDVIFFFDLLKANKLEWEPYAPGAFPDNVTSIRALNTSTVSLTLNRSYNRNWFTYNELSQIIPWPLAWDITGFPSGVTATSGTLPATPSGTLPDTTTTGAKAVAAFLSTQAKDTAAYGKSPIWSIVDGPWRLTSLSTNGQADFVRNPRYSGPTRNKAKTFTELPFTSTSAEFNQLLASQGSTSLQSGQTGQLSVGYIPPSDLTSKSRIAANGYKTSSYYSLQFNFAVVNMQNPKVGPIFKQLYVRQALQRLIDQPTWVNVFYHGAAQPTYSPILAKPKTPFATAVKNPYPFSIQEAKALLTSHGWKVKKNGLTTCEQPAKCGHGISKGAQLNFNLLYTSGNSALHDVMTSFASNASEIGVKVNLSSGPFSEVTGDVVPICVPGKPTTKCGWQMLAWGGWVYTGGYPTGAQLFASGANGNYGGWSSRTTDNLINATVRKNAKGDKAMNAYQENIAKNLPGILFLPTPGNVVAVASGLKNFTYNPMMRLAPEMW